MGASSADEATTPSPFNYILSFLLVGICWGMTTPFIRKAAVNYSPPTHPSITDPSKSWISRQIAKAFFTVIGLVRKPTYAIPLVANLTGSIWFFLLVGQAELSLTVPITNSLAFLFTVLGEYLAEGKLVSRDTWIGMFSLGVKITTVDFIRQSLGHWGFLLPDPWNAYITRTVTADIRQDMLHKQGL